MISTPLKDLSKYEEMAKNRFQPQTKKEERTEAPKNKKQSQQSGYVKKEEVI